jgi:cysteinyl-tRNA synthetase
MVEKHLPDGADIHGGGTDLRFPHHENELAQSAGAHPDRTFVRAWAHHGMITLASGKMAKSLGNILDVKRAVELHGRNALRMWFLQGHYSQPIAYSEEILEEKKRSYERLQNLYARIAGSTSSSDLDGSLLVELRERFDAAMRDDFNTPEAIAALFEAARRAGQEISTHPNSMREFAGLKKAFEELLGGVLGFELSEDQMVYVPSIPGEERFGETTVMLGPGPEVKEKVDRREQARQQKDWTTADQLRDELRAEGWSIEDTPEGPVLIRR